jgi:hypothetical protein
MQIQFGNRYFEIISSNATQIHLKKYLNNGFRIIIDKLKINQLNSTSELKFFEDHSYQASYGFTNKKFVLFLTKMEGEKCAFLFNLNSGTLFLISLSGKDELFNNNIVYGEILTTKQTNIFFIEDIVSFDNQSLFGKFYNERFQKIIELLQYYEEDPIFNDIHLVHKEFVKMDKLINIFDFYNEQITQISKNQNIQLKTNIIRFIPNKLFNLNYDLKMIMINDFKNYNLNNNKIVSKLDKTKSYNFRIMKDDEYTDVYNLYDKDECVGKAYIKDLNISKDLSEQIKVDKEIYYKCIYNIKFSKWTPIEKI